MGSGEKRCEVRPRGSPLDEACGRPSADRRSRLRRRPTVTRRRGKARVEGSARRDRAPTNDRRRSPRPSNSRHRRTANRSLGYAAPRPRLLSFALSTGHPPSSSRTRASRPRPRPSGTRDASVPIISPMPNAQCPIMVSGKPSLSLTGCVKLLSLLARAMNKITKRVESSRVESKSHSEGALCCGLPSQFTLVRNYAKTNTYARYSI